MWNPIILSDEEKTPLPSLSNKLRTLPETTVFVLDDDPTPLKSTPSSASFVPETPTSDISFVKCTFPIFDHSLLSGNGELICLESENDQSESASRMKNRKENTTMAVEDKVEERVNELDSTDLLGDASISGGSSSQDDVYQVDDCPGKESFSMEQMGNPTKQKRGTKCNSEEKNISHEAVRKKKTKGEERIRIMEEKKIQKEQEKLQKATVKAQAAELKKKEKEKQMWKKGKFALNSIVAEFDTSVVELGTVGGLLLTKFADKGLTYSITSNSIERSVMWTMSAPEHICQLSPEETEIQYVALVYEAEEFYNLIMTESLVDHVSLVRSRYPSHIICYLSIGLMAYVNKRGKEEYKKRENDDAWRCSAFGEVLARLTTHFVRVHYRLCTDEAELAEHVVCLTRSLASCQFRKKSTLLSVNANGSFIPKDFVDRNLIKKSPWLKALVAIPKVQPRCAIAIWKKYPTMKSLLSVYMDPNKSVHVKEFLLENLITEGFLGGERRVGQICSKRVYRILMSQSGNIKTDNVEDGADSFREQSA